MANVPFVPASLATHLIRVCALAVVLLAAPSARAAAPWCDALAQTIAAPPPIVAQERTEIRVWSCGDAAHNNAVHQSPASPQQHPEVVSSQSADKALGILPAWPAPPAATLTAVPEAERAARPGYSTSVYRPPR